jgi:hypothetical protein
VLATAPRDELVALAGVALVYLSARSPFTWTRWLPAPHAARQVIRRLLRSLVFLAPLPFLPAPELTPPPWALGAGLVIGVAAVATQWRETRRWLQPAYLRLLGPVTPVDRARDLIHASVGGAAQEYLYRGAVLIAFTPLLGPGAVLLAATLFVVEHLVQRDAVWDRKDIALHAALSLALGAVAYAGGGLLPAIIGHTIYNLPNVIVTLRRPGEPARPGATAQTSAA